MSLPNETIPIRRPSPQLALSRRTSTTSTGHMNASSSTSPEPSRDRSPSTSTQVALRSIRRLEARRHIQRTRSPPSTNPNPPVDFRALDYTSPYDDNLICPICRCPLVDPVLLSNCGHCFCTDCITQTWTPPHPLGPRGDCPTCRSPARVTRSPTGKILTNILDDLVVRCPRTDEGCTKEVKRGEVADHLALYCGYALTPCPAESCELPVRRRDANEGEGCLHYSVCCVDCHATLPKAQLSQHQEAFCPSRQIACEQCDTSVQSRLLAQHTRDECPATSVPCPGAAFGCPERLERLEAARHAQTCALARLKPFLESQQQRLEEQETAQKLLRRKLEVMEAGFANMRSLLGPESPEPSSETDPFDFPALTSQSPRPVSSPPQPAPETEYTHLLSLHESLRTELSHLSTSLHDLEARTTLQTLNENIRTREEVAYLGAQVGGLGRQVRWLSTAEVGRQQRGRVGGGGGGGGGAGGTAGEGGSVAGAVDAVGAVGQAIRGIVGGGDGAGGSGRVMEGRKRGSSDEGRTKL